MKRLTLDIIKNRIDKKYEGNISILSSYYKNSKDKLDCYCHLHDKVFKYTYNKLIRIKNPCPMCNSKLNNSIIDRLSIIHSNKYDYSLCVDKVKSMIDIICKHHDVFRQNIYSHLNGSGCPKCFGLNKTTEEFILDCNKIHGNKYDYSKVIYRKAHDKIIIICPKHGEFRQKANNHLNGQECKLCSTNVLKKNEFINILNRVHNCKYEYDRFEFKNRQSIVEVNCKKHGYFKIKLGLHINGTGCKKCSDDLLRHTLEEFILLSNKKHNNKYDYSKSEYLSAKNKVIIICPKHGEFRQVASDHLGGSGCQICKSSKGEIRIKKYLESINIIAISEFKFKDCKNKLPLPFDFYLPNERICIEYDGIAHYKSIDYFGGDKHLNDTKIRDLIKTNYCISNGIRLIRIPYFNFNKIESILENILVKNKQLT